MNIEPLLAQAEAYVNQDQRGPARAVLAELLRQDQENETAWLLSARVSDKPDQVLYCLRRVLKINPGNSQAQVLLQHLQESREPAPAPILPPDQPLQTPAENVPPLKTEPDLKKPEASPPGSEQAFYQDGKVLITRSRLVFGNTTLLIPDLLAVRVKRQKRAWKTLLGFLLLLAAFVLLGLAAIDLVGYVARNASLPQVDLLAPSPLLIRVLLLAVPGVLLLAAGLVLLIRKPRISIQVSTPAGNYTVIKGRDAARLTLVARRLQQAISVRGMPAPPAGS